MNETALDELTRRANLTPEMTGLEVLAATRAWAEDEDFGVVAHMIARLGAAMWEAHALPTRSGAEDDRSRGIENSGGK